MSATIYYFSATGNSLQAALDIAEGIGDAEVISIAKSGMNVTCDSDIIGFVFPVFAWGLPNMVRDFIASGSFNKDAYIFAIVTCGAAIGTTAHDADVLLRAKGAKLSYAAKLRMVANYIIMYDVNTLATDAILKKAEIKLSRIIADLNNRKKHKIKRGLGLMYKSHQKAVSLYKMADKDYTVSKSCDGCARCVAVCPAKNISLVDKKPVFWHKCEHCLACFHWCPKKAINYKNRTKNKNRYHHPKVKASQLP